MTDYSEKEIIIFKGVSKLMADGADLSGIRSSRIAKARGVGKSTLYDYFKTKDEIIAKAIKYSIETQIEVIRRIVEETEDFTRCVNLLFDQMIANHSRTDSVFRYMVTLGGPGKIIRNMNDAGDILRMENILCEFKRQMTKLLKKGEKRGVIKLSFEKGYIAAVIKGVVALFSDVNCDCSPITAEKFKEYAYEMLVKALN